MGAATILDFAGAARPVGMQSESLRPFLEDPVAGLPRSVVKSGLNGSVAIFDSSEHLVCDWEMAVRRFNASSVLKLVCCPRGCLKQGTMFPKTPDRAQVVLMSLGWGEEGDIAHERNVLDLA